MTQSKEDKQLAARLGQKMRALRREKKVTLVELSEKTGVAQATLSRIETGLMTGTIESHEKISEALGVSLSQFYEGVDKRSEKTAVQNAGEAKKIYSKNDSAHCELLTQEISKKKITPLLITLSAQGKTNMETLERGNEKFIFVLEGNIKAVLGKEEFTLNPEETLYFDASIPHQLINAGSKQARVLCTISSI